MTIDYSRVYTELDLHETEFRVLVAVITHWNVYQRPAARTHELEPFIEDREDFVSCGVITRLIKRGFLEVVGRNSVMGGEHLLRHTPRADRLLGVKQLVAEKSAEFWAAIRGEIAAQAAE